VLLVEYDDVIQTFSACRTDEAFATRILPGRLRRADDFLDSHVSNALPKLMAIDAVAITNQEPRCRLIRKRLDDLLGSPSGRRMGCNVEMHDVSAVVAHHRQGWKLYWRWKSRAGPGRPKIAPEIRRLIQRMSRDNPLWGIPRIQSELALLGHIVVASTIDEYRISPRKPPSQTSRTFLDNHARDIMAVDFFTVPTATFRILFCFIVLRYYHRVVVHFNVSAHLTAEWTGQQVTEAFPHNTAPQFMIRDRDSIYGAFFQERVKHMGIEQVLTAYRSRREGSFPVESGSSPGYDGGLRCDKCEIGPDVGP
jgi:hypothetical protein